MAEMTALKQMSRTRGLKVGHFVCEFCTPGIGHLLKAAGCDFVWLDMEHSGFGFETMKTGLRFMEAADMPAMVRVPSGSYDHVARACDMGAEGLTVPNVRSGDEAARIVSHMKYAPVGHRGVALGIAHARDTGGPVADKLAHANERTTFFALIESKEGIGDVDAIAAVDGVDCLFLGHFDLSVSLGIPGDFGHARFRDALAAMTEAAKRHGKSLGRNVGSAAEAADAYRAGFDFITYSGDVWIYQQAVAAGLAAIRKDTGQEPWTPAG